MKEKDLIKIVNEILDEPVNIRQYKAAKKKAFMEIFEKGKATIEIKAPKNIQ